VASLNAQGSSVLFPEDNAITNLQARAGSGDAYVNNTGALKLAMVDPLNTVPGVSATGSVLLVSGGDIASELTGSYAVQGAEVSLFAGGALGSSASPLQVGTPSLIAEAEQGIYIDLNRFGPQSTDIHSLVNTLEGNIVVNAYGGARTLALVDNPNGGIAIHTHSPLEVLFGARAGTWLTFTTSGTSNEMVLDGVFSYDSAYQMTTAVGSGGQLVQGPSVKYVVSGVTPQSPAEQLETLRETTPDASQALDRNTSVVNESTDFGDTATSDTGSGSLLLAKKDEGEAEEDQGDKAKGAGTKGEKAQDEKKADKGKKEVPICK
jgi:hypothetical protein